MANYDKDICKGIPNLEHAGVAYYMYGLDANELALLDKPEPERTLDNLNVLPNSDLSLVRNIKEYKGPKEIVAPIVQKITPPPVVIKKVSKDENDDDKIIKLVLICLLIALLLKKSGMVKNLLGSLMANATGSTLGDLTVAGGGSCMECTGERGPPSKTSYMRQMPPPSYLGPEGQSPIDSVAYNTDIGSDIKYP